MTEWAFCPHGADLSVPVDPLVRTIGVAIPIPEPWGDVLQERRADYGDGQAWTIPTHVTLLPPTQISQARLSAVDDHLRSVSQSETAFEIELGGAQTFRPTTPTVFLSLSTGGDDCSRLETQIRTGPLRRRLLFPYQPHVTLAFDVPDETLDRAFADHQTFQFAFRAEGFTRYELGEDGIWLPEQDYEFGWPAA